MVDSRLQPTFNGGLSTTLSALVSTQFGRTINFTGGGSIADGTAYDSTEYVIRSGTATRATDETFTIPPAIATTSSVIGFVAPSTRANNQTGIPRDVTFTVRRFMPWFIGTRATAPTLSTQLTDLAQQGNDLSARNGFTVTGTTGQTVT